MAHPVTQHPPSALPFTFASQPSPLSFGFGHASSPNAFSLISSLTSTTLNNQLAPHLPPPSSTPAYSSSKRQPLSTRPLSPSHRPLSVSLKRTRRSESPKQSSPLSSPTSSTSGASAELPHRRDKDDYDISNLALQGTDRRSIASRKEIKRARGETVVDSRIEGSPEDVDLGILLGQ